MKFTRSKKLTFFNNKGGVGKTTLAYNCAVEFAKKGYKTVLVDLDPQCNLTRLALGDEYYENTLFSYNSKTVYDVLKGVSEGGSDIDLTIEFEPVKQGGGNLSLLRGSLMLSDYENLLSTAYNQAAAGDKIGCFITSAINRFLNAKALSDQVDIFIIDTSPTLGLLNRVILLGTDYFIVPMNPDAFSLQGIEHLGVNLENWKRNWKDTGRVMSKSKGIESQFVLDGEGLFIGYVLNSYNVYGEQPIKDHRKWIEQIPGKVKAYLSERHSRNGLVAATCESSLQDIQDYGRIPAICQETGDAIFTISPAKFEANQIGTKANIEKAKEEFDELSDKILAILEKY
jgi:chromosome partitioning protein